MESMPVLWENESGDGVGMDRVVTHAQVDHDGLWSVGVVARLLVQKVACRLVGSDDKHWLP